jgi:hypothetical protein
MRALPVLCVLGCVLCALCAAAPAAAQVERPQRAAHGLFGTPPPPDADHRTSVDLNVSAYGGYDDNVAAEQGTASAALLDPRLQTSGYFSAVDVGAALDRTGRTFDVGLSGGTNARYYPSLTDSATIGAQAGVGFGAHGKSRQFRVSVYGTHQPYYGVVPFVPVAPPDLGGVTPPRTDTTVQRRDANAYGGNAMFEQSLGSRSSLSFEYSYHYMGLERELKPLRTHLGGGHFRRSLSNTTALRLGYVYQQGNGYALDVRQTVVHNLDAGFDYDKALGRTRRTNVTASFGAAMVDQYGLRTWRAIGDATIKREIGRTWSARGVYHRGLGFLDGFNSPYFADSVSGSLQGLLSRRLDFTAALFYTNGELGIAVRANDFKTYSATTRLRYALTQLFAVYGEYVAYRYDFRSGVGLPTGLPPTEDRQGVRAGLTLLVPVLR